MSFLERLQAELYDGFREGFLWGRRHLINVCTSRLERFDANELVWVDMGGGTGANIVMMSQSMDIRRFKKIYMVDLTPSLCAEAQKKVDRWVHCPGRVGAIEPISFWGVSCGQAGWQGWLCWPSFTILLLKRGLVLSWKPADWLAGWPPARRVCVMTCTNYSLCILSFAVIRKLAS